MSILQFFYPIITILSWFTHEIQMNHVYNTGDQTITLKDIYLFRTPLDIARSNLDRARKDRFDKYWETKAWNSAGHFQQWVRESDFSINAWELLVQAIQYPQVIDAGCGEMVDLPPDKFGSPSFRVEALYKLRNLLGPELYYNGWMPPAFQNYNVGLAPECCYLRQR